jgi:hypothetical protein
MKVLMLGWEFPPLFNGGLGVATYGIVKALSRQAEVRLILPNNTSVAELSNVAITGLNQISARELQEELAGFDYSSFASRIHDIPLALYPYHYTNTGIGKKRPEEQDTPAAGTAPWQEIRQLFSGTDVYGLNVMEKVDLFAQLAGYMAADGDFDVIHAHDWITFPAAVGIKERTGKPLVVHVHSLETDRAGESSRNEVYDIEKNALQEADTILTVSEFTRQQIARHYHVDAAKISVVHNGIDPEPVQRNAHVLNDKLVVFLGRITTQKGPDFLIETAEKVLRVYPRVKFVVAGMGDQFPHAIEASAAKKLGRNFIFTGFLSKAKVTELLSTADVFFMPSVSEPFGLAALEAVQHRVPCVLSRQSGAAEVIKASLKGDFWDTGTFANYIYALLRYPALCKELTARAYEELSRLTWEHAASKIMNAYGELLEDEPATLPDALADQEKDTLKGD